MITTEIQFHAPRTTAEALDLLARHGDDAKLLGGGMSLVPTMNLGLARPEILISLNHVAELAYVTDRGSEIAIGGRTRHRAVVESPLVAAGCAVLAEAGRHIGDVQVRNRGTIGGSIAHADPAADYLPVLAVLGATIVVRSARAERAIPAAEFFVDIMFTALEPDELVAEVRVPRLGPGTGAAYRRLARVEGSFAIVNAAAVVGPGGVRVAIGGIGPRPVVVELTELTGGRVTASSLDAIGSVVRDAVGEPYGDLNGDPEYRREMAVVFARRALQAAAERIPA
jgi:aerobic carbon-monoxide dehydrogenase medium subunit